MIWILSVDKDKSIKDLTPYVFSWDNKLQIAAYKRFVSREEPEKIIKHYSKANMPAIMGSEKFIKGVKIKGSSRINVKITPEG